MIGSAKCALKPVHVRFGLRLSSLDDHFKVVCLDHQSTSGVIRLSPSLYAPGLMGKYIAEVVDAHLYPSLCTPILIDQVTKFTKNPSSKAGR
jgi:hypothetical protein